MQVGSFNLGKFFLYTALVSFSLGFVMSVFIWNGYLLEVPDSDRIKRYKLPYATQIFSNDSVLLGKIYKENRVFTPIEEMPDSLLNCLIATEDIRFYSHHGVDVIGAARVLYKSILLSQKAGGGSTITQQLVKNRYPRKSFGDLPLVFHKLREWFTAVKFENLYSKAAILEHYLNTVPFGNNCFGIHTASAYYFQKKPSELEVGEMATLVGMLKGTTLYDPIRNPDRCLERRNLVLSNMQRNGFLSENQLNEHLKFGLRLNQSAEGKSTIAPFFRQHIKTKLEELIRSNSKYGVLKYNPYIDGLKVYTTIDSRVQMYAENALEEEMNRLQALFDQEWNEARWKKEQQKLIRLLRQKKYPGYLKVIEYLEKDKPLPDEIKVLLSSMTADLRRLHAGFTCIKNSGEVLAWVGGRNFNSVQYDHVKSRRQVGSVFKPIVYVTAVDQGVNLCNYFKNNKQSYQSFDDWQPKNATENYVGEYTMKGALTYSLNVISVQVLFRAGLSDVLNLARQMGIRTDIPNVPSISLGTPDISLFEMVNAYTCFPNGGKRVSTRFLNKIYAASGDVIYQNRPEAVKVLFSKNVADVMNNMLESVVNSGTARSLRTEYNISGPLAGKTGTSQNQADGWFIGYTPQFTAGAWVGADSPEVHFESISTGAGAKTALPIWASFVSKLRKDGNFDHLFEGAFTLPNARSMSCLNLPLYRPSPKELKED